jgi:hypothetical protein
MNSEIKKINIENTDDQSNIVSKSHKAFEIIDQETDEECVRLQINNNRSSQRTAYQNQDKPAVSSNPFIYDDLEEWVESEGDAKSIDQINFTTPCKSEEIQRNNNTNYELEFRNPYIVYRFKNVITVFRIYFYIYVLIQLAVACYIGSALGGSFGYPVEFWILTITVIKIMIDASILAHFLGQHQDRLIAPAIISTGVFSFLALLVFITPKITRFFLY